MKTTSYSTPDKDHLQVALEASYGVLIGLQWILAQLPEDAYTRATVPRQMRQAMESLRQAIAELRLARGETGDTLMLGFVLNADATPLGGPPA